MSAEVRIIKWRDVQRYSPRPDSFPTYRPSVEPVLEVHPDLLDSVKGLVTDQVSMIEGYGSIFSGEGREDSWVDLNVYVYNPRRYFEQQGKRYPTLHALVNLLSPNYYYTDILVDGKPRRTKLGVIGVDNFVSQAQASLKESGHLGHVYTSGRKMKAGHYLLVEGTSPEIRSQIDQATNRARIDGVWLALGLVNEIFDYQTLLREYVNLSYAADVRLEKKDKVDQIINQNALDYDLMMQDLLGAFVQKDVIEEVGGGFFRKKISLEEREVRDWLREGKGYFIAINYIKNPLTPGVVQAFEYGVQKAKRAIGSAPIDRKTVLFAAAGTLLAAGIAYAFLHRKKVVI